MTTSTNNRRRPSRRQRAAAVRAANAGAGRFVTGAHAAATDAAVQSLPADVREVAAGSRATRRRDTSRRSLARTSGAGSKALNVESTRRDWRGEREQIDAGPLRIGAATPDATLADVRAGMAAEWKGSDARPWAD